MSQKNQVSFKLADADLSEINAAIATLKSKLLPHLKSLNAADRHELPKMGDKTVAFVRKALDHCSQNPEIAPQFLDVDEFKTDVEAVESIRHLYAPLLQITDALGDTMMLSGSEGYSAALTFYNAVKSAQKSNIPKAGTIYEDLSSRFPGKSITAAKAAAEAK
jgi:hypothetical protein